MKKFNFFIKYAPINIFVLGIVTIVFGIYIFWYQYRLYKKNKRKKHKYYLLASIGVMICGIIQILFYILVKQGNYKSADYLMGIGLPLVFFVIIVPFLSLAILKND
jgi:H+/Cl- antiporter ClcA